MANGNGPWANPFNTDSGKIASAPVLAGDVLVVPGGTELYGVSIYDGAKVWSYQVAEAIKQIATAKGTVFLLGYCADYLPNNTSNTDDSDPYGDQSSGGPYDNSGDATLGLIALDAGSGKLKAARNIDGQPNHLQVEDDVLVVSDSSGDVYGFDISAICRSQTWLERLVPSLDGALLWHTQPTGGFTGGSVAVGDKAVFFVADSVTYCVNVRSGQTRWSFPNKAITTKEGAPDPDYQLLDGDTLDVSSQPMVGNRLVIVGGSLALYALNWDNGKIVWKIPIPGGE